MITRLVKMEFSEANAEKFVHYFEQIKPTLVKVNGLQEVQLLRDVSSPNIVFTKSIWNSVQDLNTYRKSEFFGEIWPETKKLFSKRPEAWSLTLK